ncbi:hypothetical protein JY448_12410 [Stenotrophomonas maltophilia]|nr:hypothetical protein [Stenotrophomonas maltophilia]
MADLAIDVTARWAARRQTMNSNGIVGVLSGMCGYRIRCMYCGDSEACDVEHFFPKAVAEFRCRVFDWNNLLFICTPCNRLKNAKFRILSDGSAAFINPVEDDPWDFFDFVEETGELVPRADLEAYALDRAATTIHTENSRISFETVTESRRQAARSIRRAVESFLRSDKGEADSHEFIADLVSTGRPELVRWYFSGEFPVGPVYQEFSLEHAVLIPEVKREIADKYPGAWP